MLFLRPPDQPISGALLGPGGKELAGHHCWLGPVSEKDLTQECYDVKAAVHQINFTVGQTSEVDPWDPAEDEEEETLTLQKMVTDWQNYTRLFGSLRTTSAKTGDAVRSLQATLGASPAHQPEFRACMTWCCRSWATCSWIISHPSWMTTRRTCMTPCSTTRFTPRTARWRGSRPKLEGHGLPYEIEIGTIFTNINATDSHV